MEVVIQGGRRVCREMSPERGKMCVQARMMKPTFKKVQIVYYLSRNGHLEHPHYMEVTHLSHQQLRLKDVMDRLTVLRGKGMPSLYSWSCKRSYKNGYVWNDLAENDVIHPSEGAEYVLKGSELIEGCTEKLRHHVQVGIGNVQLESSQNSSLTMQPKRKSLASKQQRCGFEAEEMANNRYNEDHGRDEEEEDDDEEEECVEKRSYTTRSTPRWRLSRGVSTDEVEEFKQPKTNGTAELSLETNSLSSPPSTTSSTLSEKANNESIINEKGSTTISKRFEDCDAVGNEPFLSRNSVLLSLIACGGSASFRKAAPPRDDAARKSGSLHKGVVCKAAAAAAAAEKVPVDDEDEVMIGTMSENPRFGNLQSEEKEYFSGSIVEEVAMERIEVAPLKKSSSHNEERSAMSGLGEAGGDEQVQKKKGGKGKCMPMKKSAYKQCKK
ncbi:hypothetical protein C2S52_009376 [Perilla frutescens var. hirtella]|nr:hypothetical protein C2S52_009376 [Perilla frutescens var. hirtella]